MCGIAGFCNVNWNREKVILDMNDRIIKRGPDAGGYWCDDKSGMTLGHRRLSIVDLSENGAQPMFSHSGRYVLVYNGEIYNAQLLRDKLLMEGKVTSFRGSSDTEILLETCCAYGVKTALSLAKGMFAIALYDRETGEITLARDRVGEKPLYYGHVNGTFVFGSDLAVLKAIPSATLTLDREALQNYLRYGYVPAPLSIYEGIYKCLPGHILTSRYPYDAFEDTIYYDLTEEYQKAQSVPFKGSFTDAVEELDTVLRNAVQSQMMADVPLGAFLSGGIDSSVIVSMMQSMSHEKIKTFTIGFQEQQFNEAPEAQAIADYLGTEHTSLILSEEELQNVVPHIPDIFAEPFADSSQIPTYLVSRLAREKVTVSLSGDAGDELFCGYNTYWKCEGLYRRVNKIPPVCKKAAGHILLHTPFRGNNTLYRSANCLLAEDIANLHEAVCYDTTCLTDRLLINSASAHQKQKLLLQKDTVMDEMMLRDLTGYHPDDILVKVDRAGMAVSLENRVPMLDLDVLSFAFSLPAQYKCSMVDNQLISKRVLKEVLYRYVPKEIMDRPKKGFSVPLTRWLQNGRIHDWANEILEDSMLVKDGILSRSAVNDLQNGFMKNGQNKGLLWNVIVLEQWYRHEK